MARRSQSIGFVVCVLAAQHVAAQDVLGKTFATDALFSGMKKDVHSHLQRMLQIETEPPKEPANLEESCSPAALARDKKYIAKPHTESKRWTKSITTPAPNCEGPNCLVAPMPSSKAVSGGKSSFSELQAPPQKVVTYGPMTQEAYERMVHRKRASLRVELQKAGTLTAELDAFLKTSDGPVTDAFGIPLPAAPKMPQPRADFEMRFAPQAPATDPATAAATATTTTTDATAATTTTSDAVGAAGKKASASLGDFEMRFEPQTPAPDPNLIRNELEAFMAASPVGASTRTASRPHTSAGARSSSSSSVSSSTASVSPKREAARTERRATTQSGASGPTQPPMTEQEAARLAAQQAASAAAREAALARKRQTREEPTAKSSSSGGKKVMRASGSTNTTTSTATSTTTNTTASVHHSATTQRQQPQLQRPSTVGSRPTITSANVRRVKRSATTTSLRGALGYLMALSLLAAFAAALFVAAAVAEDILMERTTSGGDWLVLTRGLWRRCRRAFSAARKQLTGHCSDLPLSANEGTGPLARAVAAASMFVHVFWSHLADHRGQHISGAVAAALDASRRASVGGLSSDSASAGGAFGGPQFQQVCYDPPCVIPADTSAAATAAAELSLRRRH